MYVFHLLGCAGVDALLDSQSTQDCVEVQASFECEEGPIGDATGMWKDQPGYGWPDRAVWGSSLGSVNLYVTPEDVFDTGLIDLTITPPRISALQINVSECDLPYCTWLIRSGSVNVTGELSDCNDDVESGGDACVAGTLNFDFGPLTFESGATTEAMTLQAGFGPDQPAH